MKHYIALVFLVSLYIHTKSQEPAFNNISIKVDNSSILLYQQSYALLIGVSDYSDDWPDLPGVKKDILAVKDALEQHFFHVEVIENPSKQEMDNAISSFIARNGQAKENRILFYFGGHGHTINTSYGGKLGYFVPADAPNPYLNEASFQSKSIEMAQIEIYAKRIQSKHAIFLFDACFSGSLFATTRAIPEIISYKTTQPIRQFITSGTENEQVPDKSIFREQFVSALSSDMADGNKDGYITGSELGDYLQTTVTNYSYNSQHPQYGKIRNPMLDKGDYVFIVPGATMENETRGQKEVPELGEAMVLESLGGIEITAKINGTLYLDGVRLGSVSENTIIPINNVTAGEHSLEIRGENNWNSTAWVIKGKNTRIVAKVNPGESKYERSRSGGFTDPRYNIKYKWIRIGKQIWMAENLNYKTHTGSWCPNGKEENCTKYGRLYDWETASKVCPEGWHLPSDDEWKELERSIGMSIKESEKTSFRGRAEGGKLKQGNGRDWKSPNKGSTNENNFSAIPAGYRKSSGEFQSIFMSAIFWSSTASGSAYAYCRELYYNRTDIYRDLSNKMNAFSVRCVKDSREELY